MKLSERFETWLKARRAATNPALHSEFGDEILAALLLAEDYVQSTPPLWIKPMLAKARTAERERCAEMAEKEMEGMRNANHGGYVSAGHIVAAIRALKDEE